MSERRAKLRGARRHMRALDRLIARPEDFDLSPHRDGDSFRYYFYKGMRLMHWFRRTWSEPNGKLRVKLLQMLNVTVLHWKAQAEKVGLKDARLYVKVFDHNLSTSSVIVIWGPSERIYSWVFFWDERIESPVPVPPAVQKAFDLEISWEAFHDMEGWWPDYTAERLARLQRRYGKRPLAKIERKAFPGSVSEDRIHVTYSMGTIFLGKVL